MKTSATKANQRSYSSDVEELLERREMDVTCWQCGFTKAITLQWVSTHRDMRCAECETLIILNTSRIQSEVAQLRRQLSALHAQMSSVFGDKGKIERKEPPPNECKQRFKPALATVHASKGFGRANAVVSARK